MAERHEIELFISDEGELKIHIKGIKGAKCLNVLDELAKEMGKVKEKQLTDEYYETLKDTTKAKIQRQ